jgi:amidase
MARSVTDVAIALGVMTGVDAADTATARSAGHAERDYTTQLDAQALKGARIGIARDFAGQNADVDWVVEASLQAMRAAGATVVDVRFPKWLLDAKEQWYNAVRFPEFPVQIEAYLKATPAAYPKTLAQMIERVRALPSINAHGNGPNTSRWLRFEAEAASGTLDDYRYRSVRDHALPMMRDVVNGILTANRLDAIVYPTSPTLPDLIAPSVASIGGMSGTNIANLTGFPDLIVPAGFSASGLPVGLSFLGTAWSEARLIALGYSFEQHTKARRRPVHTPSLASEAIVLK